MNWTATTVSRAYMYAALSGGAQSGHRLAGLLDPFSALHHQCVA